VGVFPKREKTSKNPRVKARKTTLASGNDHTKQDQRNEGGSQEEVREVLLGT
jgi:hypothetical protein